MKKISKVLLAVLLLSMICGINSCLPVDIREAVLPNLTAGAYNPNAEEIYTEGAYIIINTKFTTPTPCYVISEPRVDTIGESLQFSFSIDSTLGEGQMCAQVISEKNVNVRYGPMLKGRHVVSVLATYPSIGWEGVKIGPKEVTTD